MNRPLPHPRTAAPEPVPATEPRLPLLLEVLGVAGLVVVAVLGSAVCVLLTPARIGTVLVPVGVLLAVVLTVLLPRLAWSLLRSRGVAALTVLAFFAVGWVLSMGPGGDVLLPLGADGQSAVSYATLLLPVVVGTVTTVRLR